METLRRLAGRSNQDKTEEFMKQILTVSAIIAALALTACGGESRFPEATGKGSIRAINAIPSSPAISLLIEERNIASLEYKSSTGTTPYDDLDYTFNFEAVIPNSMLPGVDEPGSSLERIASQYIDVVKDTTYTMVLSGDLLNPAVTVWERPEPEFAEGATNFEIQVGHAGATLGPADVYFADPATPPAAGNALGTIAEGEVLPVASFEAGEYVLTLTAPGDPGTVLFESETVVNSAGNAYLFVAFDPDARDVSPVAMRRINIVVNQATRIPDANYAATYRFFHTSADAGAVDVYADDPLTEPVLAGLDFGGISADVPMPSGTVPITVTAAGNQGVVIDDVDRLVVTGVRYFAYLFENTSGGSSLIEYIPDLRAVETFAKLSVINTVPGENPVDFYVLASDSETPFEDANPVLFGLVPSFAPIKLEFNANSYDVYVTVSGEKTVLAGPLALDLGNGDIVQALITENVDPAVVDVTFLPLP
jgi:hypothetical protein